MDHKILASLDCIPEEVIRLLPVSEKSGFYFLHDGDIIQVWGYNAKQGFNSRNRFFSQNAKFQKDRINYYTVNRFFVKMYSEIYPAE